MSGIVLYSFWDNSVIMDKIVDFFQHESDLWQDLVCINQQK